MTFVHTAIQAAIPPSMNPSAVDIFAAGAETTGFEREDILKVKRF